MVKERLDRVLSNPEWLSLFPSGRVQNLPMVASDHSPLLVDTAPLFSKGCHPFRFYEAWFNDISSFDIINAAWKGSGNGFCNRSLLAKMQCTRGELQKWKKEVFGECDVKLKLLETQLMAIQSSDVDDHAFDEERRIRRKFEEVIQSEANGDLDLGKEKKCTTV
ncbi:hypothetical protein G4B88_023517, partial [Cannabis sativa]